MTPSPQPRSQEGGGKMPTDTGYRARRNLLIVALLLALILETWWFGVQALRQPDPIITVGEITLLTPDTVCPGDVMRFQYTFTARQAGVLSINTTIRIKDGVTVLSIPSREVIVEQPMTLTVEQVWVVPTVFASVLGGVQGWDAGDYARIVAFTSIGEERTPVIRQTAFRIGACSFDAGENN